MTFWHVTGISRKLEEAEIQIQHTSADPQILTLKAKMERALHAITNEAHPKHPAIFALAMEGLSLEHLTSKMQEREI